MDLKVRPRLKRLKHAFLQLTSRRRLSFIKMSMASLLYSLNKSFPGEFIRSVTTFKS